MLYIFLVFSFVLSLLAPISSDAAIAYVSHTEFDATLNVSSISKSITVATGTDRGAYVCSQVRRSSGVAHGLTSAVFNGSESFTKIREDVVDFNGSGMKTELWRAVGLTETTANLVLTYAGLNQIAIAASVTQFTGVSQSSPVDSQSGNSGTGTTPSVTITTIADNAAILDCIYGQASAGLTVGAGQTARSDRLVGGAFADAVGVSTVVGKTPAGSEAMNWTQSGSTEKWVTSTVSMAPSGGVDPEPETPGQATITWLNGNDPGSPSSGIASTTVRRCTGSSCNATTAPAIGTVSYPITTFVDSSVAVNTTYGYSAFHTDGVGLVSTSTATVYVTTSGTPPATPPSITSADTTASGSTLTYGATTPTKIRVETFTNSGVVASVIHGIADFPGGVYTEDWQDGLDGVCFIPIDASNIENPDLNDRKCDSLVGIVAPLDETPPVLSNCQPDGDLPAGTTEWTFSCNVNKPASAKYDTTDLAYADMANSMVLNSLTFSALQEGLTDGSTTTLYLRAQSTDALDGLHPNLTSTIVTLTVAEETADVTPPGNVANLICTIIGNAATCTWDSATDAVSYQMFQSDGACSTFAPAGNPVTTTSTQLSLAFSTTYCWKVKAFDVVNNLSASFSNTETKTTPAAPDIEPPSDLEDLAVEVFVNSTRLTWKLGSDNLGQISVNLEFCQVEIGQSDCANFNALVSQYTQTFLSPPNLTAGTRYCFRGKNADSAGNVSVNYNTPVCATTATIGVGTPHPPIPFNFTRPANTGTAVVDRPARP